MTAIDIVSSTIIIFIAFTGEATFGFGGGLLSVPLLSILIGPQDAIALVAIFQLLISGLIFTNYKYVDWHLSLPVIIGTIVGTSIGLYFMGVLDEDILRWFLAIFIFSFLIKTKFFPAASFSNASFSAGTLSGLFSGFFQGSIGLGGANLVIYFKELSKDKDAFRAHVILLLSVANLTRLVLAPMTNMFNQQVMQLSVYILPFFLVGIFCGNFTSKIITPKMYNIVIEMLLSISCLCLVLRNLRIF